MSRCLFKKELTYSNPEVTLVTGFVFGEGYMWYYTGNAASNTDNSQLRKFDQICDMII